MRGEYYNGCLLRVRMYDARGNDQKDYDEYMADYRGLVTCRVYEFTRRSIATRCLV